MQKCGPWASGISMGSWLEMQSVRFPPDVLSQTRHLTVAPGPSDSRAQLCSKPPAPSLVTALLFTCLLTSFPAALSSVCRQSHLFKVGISGWCPSLKTPQEPEEWALGLASQPPAAWFSPHLLALYAAALGAALHPPPGLHTEAPRALQGRPLAVQGLASVRPSQQALAPHQAGSLEPVSGTGPHSPDCVVG